MARLRQSRPTYRRRLGREELRRAGPDPTQVLIGLTLVVGAVVGLVYTFTL